jgi:HAD superfamily hydrolase (TIGR01549 family)
MNVKKRRKYRAVLFDKDGVLIDSIDGCLAAANATFAHYGKPEMSKEDFRTQFWGTRADINFAKSFDGAAKGKIDEVCDYYNNKKLEFKGIIKVFPSTVPVLKRLKGGYKLGVVTSSSKSVSAKLLEDFGILVYFDVVIGGEETRPKPASDPILKACKMLDVLPEDTLYVGDTMPDVGAAKSAGCEMAMLTTSFTREELEKVDGTGDFHIIDDLKELLQVLGIS